jgi:hypothetical protein
MLMDDQEFLARRETAMLKLEGATAIIDGFVNGPEGGSVETESGSIPTLATMRLQSQQLASSINAMMEEFATHINELPVEDTPE